MSLSNLIEIATDEKQTEDDWTKILDVCEKGSSSPKECLKMILKRMFGRNPHVELRSLILLDACVQNIGESFAREISSRFFVTEIKSKSKVMHQKSLERLCFMIKKWSREFSGSEFDFINELNKWLQESFPNCYMAGDEELNSRNSSKVTRKIVANQEEADIAKAIALSLQETEAKRATVYPSPSNNVVTDTIVHKKAMTKVRALYDFEAAEENELTFKAGEIIINVDTSNEHWWTGSNHRGEGMFPAQFVTLNIDAGADKSQSMAETHTFVEGVVHADQQRDSSLTPIQVATIDESRIDDCIRLIDDADPTAEMRPDPADLAKGEAQCRLMGPLIDQELEKVDRHYNRLAEINGRIIDSFQMYNDLMTQGGIMRPTMNYMWQPPYMAMHGDPAAAQIMHPGHINPQQQQLPQQQMSIDQMRFHSMNYYAGPDNIQSHEPRHTPQVTMSHHNHQTMAHHGLYHGSLDTDMSNTNNSHTTQHTNTNSNTVMAPPPPSNMASLHYAPPLIHNNSTYASPTTAMDHNLAYLHK